DRYLNFSWSMSGQTPALQRDMDKISNPKMTSVILFASFVTLLLSILMHSLYIHQLNQNADKMILEKYSEKLELSSKIVKPHILNNNFPQAIKALYSISESKHIKDIKLYVQEELIFQKNSSTLKGGISIHKKIRNNYGKEVAKLQLTIDTSSLERASSIAQLKLLLISVGIILFIWSLIATLSFYLNKSLSSVLIETQSNLKRIEASNFHLLKSLPERKFNTKEIHFFVNAYNELMNSTKFFYHSSLRKSNLEVVGKLAQQVAHDIRSPLAALEMAVKSTEGIQEDKRKIIRSAANRINDIANNLLNQNIEPESLTEVKSDLELEQVPSIISSIVSEKRMQYHSHNDLSIEFPVAESHYGQFAVIQAEEFKRVLSNLINNAVEAMPELCGEIKISLVSENENMIIMIKDNGVGIPESLIEKVTDQGESFGKPEGSGLGLYHAKSCIENWKGSLKILSSKGNGTTILIKIPKANPPATFIPFIPIHSDQEVVIIDDDVSIHKIWDSRLSQVVNDTHIHHFTTPHDFLDWFKQNTDKNFLFLVDFEYIGSEMNGLNLIKQNNIENSSILITSRYDEKEIREECEELGVNLIEKGMAGFVPIKALESKTFPKTMTSVLIDDDPLVRTIWESHCKKSNINLFSFDSISSFNEKKKELSKSTPIYIDVNLGDNLLGTDVAKTLWKEGYTEIYLTTGHDKKDFVHLTFLKGIISKSPPWDEHILPN
ncbi:MAG: sensor histidine kinase, partial [Bacteriovoracaceae bacterium]